MITENSKPSLFEFQCESCHYYTSSKGDYNKHLKTAKHKKITFGDANDPKPHICKCGKEFTHRQGLWKHKKSCANVNEIHNIHANDDKYDRLSDTILLLVKENQDFKQLLIDQSKKMMELAENMGGHNNTTNSHNKFNMTVFLNEDCKDAMSIQDFVKNMEISMEEFIETGELGYIEGISRVMVKRINDMELHTRPLHCTDLKRETVYIKDTDKWGKDANKEQLRKAVKRVAHKNQRMRSVWYDKTPDINVIGSDNCEKFFKYSQSALGGCGKDQSKTFEDTIMRNVLKEVTINKQNL